MSPVKTRAAGEKNATKAPKRTLSSTDDELQKTSKSKKTDDNSITENESKPKSPSNKDEESKRPQREKVANATPEVVETGVINYFIRGKVEIEDPKTLDEVARGYMILRPLPSDVDLTKRPLSERLRARLLALPKKQLPQHTDDRFMAFVEEAKMDYNQLSDEFLGPREYETKTAGTRHVPSATPVGEGIYAIIRTENESHMAYLATLPEKISDFQRKLGFNNRGSFIICSKNPKFPGPTYARLPSAPEYTQEILADFENYRWIETKPEHLDYKNTQLLLIGHGNDPHLAPGSPSGQKEVEREMEDLEQKDLEGMRHLSGDESESIFADLHARSKAFHGISSS